MDYTGRFFLTPPKMLLTAFAERGTFPTPIHNQQGVSPYRVGVSPHLLPKLRCTAHRQRLPSSNAYFRRTSSRITCAARSAASRMIFFTSNDEHVGLDVSETLADEVVVECVGVFFTMSVQDSECGVGLFWSTVCILYTSPSPRDKRQSRMPSSA